MRNLTKFYIGGHWVEPLSPATLPVLNPATEVQIGTVAMGNAADVDRAVAAAKAAFAGFSTTSKRQRLDLLHRLKVATERPPMPFTISMPRIQNSTEIASRVKVVAMIFIARSAVRRDCRTRPQVAGGRARTVEGVARVMVFPSAQ